MGDSLLHRRLYYSVDLTGGVQKFRRLLCDDPANPDPLLCAAPFDREAVSSGNDRVFGYELLGGWNINRSLIFETSYGRSDYAQQVVSGFTSHHYGALLKISF